MLLECRGIAKSSDTKSLGQLVSCEEGLSTGKKQDKAADEIALPKKG